MTALVFVMFLFSGTVNALENTEKKISVVDNGVVVNYITSSETVKEFFAEHNINISSNDCVNKKMDESIVNGINIEIERPFILKILVDDEQKVFNVKFNDTIGDLLKILHSEYNKEFICEQNLSFKLRNCQQLKFCSRCIEFVEKKESIPFQTKIVYSDKIDIGQERVTQNGFDGEKLITEEIILIGGKEISRTVKNEKVLKKPIDKIVTQGTYKNKCEYKNVLVMNASAYTAGFESTGKRPGDRGYGITATGAKAKKGTVAVDPRIIPLGSKLYVEGYGHATALDTGGAIKGNKIDLFYESLYEAKRFGRRNIKVYMLD